MEYYYDDEKKAEEGAAMIIKGVDVNKGDFLKVTNIVNSRTYIHYCKVRCFEGDAIRGWFGLDILQFMKELQTYGNGICYFEEIVSIKKLDKKDLIGEAI